MANNTSSNSSNLINLDNLNEADKLLDSILDTINDAVKAFNKTDIDNYSKKLKEIQQQYKTLTSLTGIKVKQEQINLTTAWDEAKAIQDRIHEQRSSLALQVEANVLAQKRIEEERELEKLNKAQKKIDEDRAKLAKFATEEATKQGKLIRQRAGKAYDSLSARQKKQVGSREQFIRNAQSNYQNIFQSRINEGYVEAYEQGGTWNERAIRRINSEAISQSNAEFDADMSDFKAGAEKISLGSQMMSWVAKTFKSAVDLFYTTVKTAMKEQANIYEETFQNISVRSGIKDTVTQEQYWNMQKNLNNTLFGMGLQGNVATADVQKTLNTIATTGIKVDLHDAEAQAKTTAYAIEQVLTNQIVPYLDTSSLYVQELARANPTMLKQIRGIGASTMELFDSNTVATKYLQEMVENLSPIASLAESEIGIQYAQASGMYESLKAQNPNLTDYEIGKMYHSVVAGYDNPLNTIQNGSIDQKLGLINTLTSGGSLQNFGDVTAGYLRGVNTLTSLIPAGTDNASIIAQNALGNLTNMGYSAFSSLTQKQNTLDFEKAIADGIAAGNNVDNAATRATAGFVNNANQTTATLQKVTLGNLTNNLSAMFESLGLTGDLVVGAIEGLGTLITTFISAKIIGGSIGKGIGAMAGIGGTSLSEASGLGALLSSAGPIALGVAAVGTAAYLIDSHIQRITGEEHEAVRQGISQTASALISSGNYKDSNAATISAMVENKYGTSYHKNYTREEMQNMGFDTSFFNVFGKDVASQISSGYNDRKSKGQVYDANKAVIAQILNEAKEYPTLKNRSPRFAREFALIAAAILLDKNHMLKDANVFEYMKDNALNLNSQSDIRSMISDMVKSGDFNENSIATFIDQGLAILDESGLSLLDARGNNIVNSISTKDLLSYTGINESKVPEWYTDKYHRTGLNSVPYDNYLAYLHEGEAVLTASTANELRALVDEYRENSQKDAAFDIIISNQTTALVEKMDEIIRTIMTGSNLTGAERASEIFRSYSLPKVSMRQMTSTKTFG